MKNKAGYKLQLINNAGKNYLIRAVHIKLGFRIHNLSITISYNKCCSNCYNLKRTTLLDV
jgi:hypothetical protein